MACISVDFGKQTGRIKPMHATNNGPVGQLNGKEVGWLQNEGEGSGHRVGENIYEFAMAGIPYARTHDASFYPPYGLEHTVDVVAIFPDFDADPTDPENYDFTCTDHYIDMIEAAGTKVFYRLGHRIEHEVKKYGTLPPKDFHKWAVICEHIIRHYTEGWANGTKRDMEYWEIWNEPDLRWEEGPERRPTWGGTKEEFFELYHITATHLKQCFPHLKIGGPAIAGRLEWAEEFLAQLKAPLDFFSWHVYAFTVEKMISRAEKVRALLDQYGFEKSESILNEWNYVRAWDAESIRYSHSVKQKSKGASFTLAAMCASQKSSVDMLMYYDARPTVWNGLFDLWQIEHSTTTGYYPFPMFNALYRMGNEVASTSEGDVYTCAARDGDRAGVVFARYNDDDATEATTVSVALTGLGERTEAEIYLLDDDHRLTLTQKMTFAGDRFEWETEVPNFTCYLILLKKK